MRKLEIYIYEIHKTRKKLPLRSSRKKVSRNGEQNIFQKKRKKKRRIPDFRVYANVTDQLHSANTDGDANGCEQRKNLNETTTTKNAMIQI